MSLLEIVVVFDKIPHDIYPHASSSRVMSRAELALSFMVNPLSLYLMWTMHIIYSRLLRLSVVAHLTFCVIAMFFYLDPFMDDFSLSVGMLLPLVMAMVAAELKKGEASVVSLYLVRMIILLCSALCYDVVLPLPYVCVGGVLICVMSYLCIVEGGEWLFAV